MPSLMSQSNGDVTVVYFTESQIIDEGRIQQISEDLMAIADKAESGKLLLNFNDVRFMSSSVLGRLVKLNKKCKADKIKLKLCNIAPDIMEVFRITKLNKVFEIEKDEAAAISAFNKRGFFG